MTGTVGRLAVLGATGSLGRQLCTAAASSGVPVLGIARRPPVGTLPGDVEFRAEDVAAMSPARLAALFDDHGVRRVVNVAGEYGDTVDGMRHSHLDLLDVLLAALRLTRVRTRLVHLGSVHEYGPVADGTSIDEDTPTRPSSAYGSVKLAASEQVLGDDGIDAVVLRVVNTVGPQPPPSTFVAMIADRLRDALRRDVSLTLDVADARRDFVDVRDVVRAVLRACEADVRGVVNIGSGVAHPIETIIAGLVEASGYPPDRLTLNRRDVTSYGGTWTCMQIGRAARTLEWSPRIELADSLRATWRASWDPAPLVQPSGTSGP